MIVWIASYPRSGNTFFRMILFHLYAIKTYSVYNDPLFDNIKVSPIIGHENLPDKIENLKESSQIYFIKTHDLPTDSSPAIYLIRDGRDSLVSYARYINSFEKKSTINKISKFIYDKYTFENTLKRLIKNENNYGGWENHVLTWYNRKNSKTIIIKYEEIINEPMKIVGESLINLDIDIEIVKEFNLPTYKELNEKWPEFFRKGKVGSWKEEMGSELHELFWEYHGCAMDLLEYSK